MFATKKKIKMLGRLKKRSDFLCVQQNGQKWVSKTMVIEMASNDGLGIRYGLTVSKKVSKSAVIRNRVKRRLKAVACDVLPEYCQHNIDLVLIGRQATTEQDYEMLQKDLRWCLKKLGKEAVGDEKTAN